MHSNFDLSVFDKRNVMSALIYFSLQYEIMEPIPVATWVCGARFLGLRVRIPPKGRGDGRLSLVSVVC